MVITEVPLQLGFQSSTNSLFQLSLALHRRARWCYLNNCWSNIYRKATQLKKDDKINEDILLTYFPNQRRKRSAES